MKGVIPAPIRIRAKMIFDDGIRIVECEHEPFIGPIHPKNIKRFKYGAIAPVSYPVASSEDD